MRWLKDEQELQDGDRYQLVSDGKKRMLVIRKSELRDEGGYVAVIGNTRASADLVVLGKSRPPLVGVTNRVGRVAFQNFPRPTPTTQQ